MAMGTINIRVDSVVSVKALPGRYVPGTGRLLAAVQHGRGSWTLTHVPSGFAVLACGSRERALACGAWFWAFLSDEGRTLLKHDDLPQRMKKDRRVRDVLSIAGHELRCRERDTYLAPDDRIREKYSAADLLAQAKEERERQASGFYAEC